MATQGQDISKIIKGFFTLFSIVMILTSVSYTCAQEGNEALIVASTEGDLKKVEALVGTGGRCELPGQSGFYTSYAGSYQRLSGCCEVSADERRRHRRKRQ